MSALDADPVQEQEESIVRLPEDCRAQRTSVWKVTITAKLTSPYGTPVVRNYSSAIGYLQRMIEPDFEYCAFLETEIVIGEQAGNRSDAGSCAGSDPGALAAPFNRA